MDDSFVRHSDLCNAILTYNEVALALQEVLMSGNTIIDIGFVDKVEGGLCIDYKKPTVNFNSRLIIGYTEIGEWIELHTDLI